MKQDGRKLSHKTLEELRIRTVKQVEAGAHPEQLATALGLNRSTVYSWVAQYTKGGMDSLAAKPISGRPCSLSESQIKWLSRVLIDKTPQQFKLPFALWTRDQIISVLKNKFGIKVSRSAISRILGKLGYTFQKPAVRFKQQDPVLVSKWVTEDYKAIKEEAKKVNADIFFGDEASVSSMYNIGKTIGKKGETPIVHRTSKRFKVNMISAVNSKGEVRFMVTEQSGTTDVFVEFLKRLVSGAKKTVFLVVDNHPIHKTKKVQEFIRKQDGKLKLFYLPPYSPELNPDELVWNSVKTHGISRHLINDLKSLKKIVYSALCSLQKRSDKVASFFKTPTTSYTLR